jgi:hypothetical protein
MNNVGPENSIAQYHPSTASIIPCSSIKGLKADN